MGEHTDEPIELTTSRLVADEWHTAAHRLGLDLVDVVTTVLMAATTAALPPRWHGDFDRPRARAWIAERDAESPTLLVSDITTGAALGLVILFEVPWASSDLVELRLGYVLAETAWGRGVATELVAGIVGATRRSPRIGMVSGGVAADNAASARVLERNGFTPVGPVDGETIYELDVRDGC